MFISESLSGNSLSALTVEYEITSIIAELSLREVAVHRHVDNGGG